MKNRSDRAIKLLEPGDAPLMPVLSEMFVEAFDEVQLLIQLKKIAAPRAALVTLVQADREGASAIALYSKLGVLEDVVQFDIDVP